MNGRWRTLLKYLVVGALATIGIWTGVTGNNQELGPRSRDTSTRQLAPESGVARVIVKYRADSTMMRPLSGLTSATPRAPLHAATMSQRLGRNIRDGRILGSRTQGLHATGLTSVQLAKELAAHPEVEWAVPDQRRYSHAATNDPFLAAGQAVITPTVGQWYLRAPDSTIVSAIDAVGAWDTTPGLASVVVAVLDTGARQHPELVSKLHAGYDFIHDPSTANDGNARDADATDTGDGTAQNFCFVGDPASDSSWHGTKIAGLIGAQTNDGIGMAGVGRNVMVLPIRVLGRCGGFDSDIIAAMRWAGGVSADVGFSGPIALPNPNPAKVINMSLGASGSCPTSYSDAIAELNAAGVSVVVSAGNGNGQALDAPANCAGAIAVTGLRHSGTKVGFSSVGPEAAIAAPAGNCVNTVGTCLFPLLTTTNTGLLAPGADAYSDGTNPTLGTSFAAPLVAGTIGLMVSSNSAMSPAHVRQVLQSTARPFVSSGADPGVAACQAPSGLNQNECYCTTSTCGAGMLSASLAVQRAFDPFVVVSVSNATPAPGVSVTLNGSASAAQAGRTITGFQWTISSGAGLASFSGPTNSALTSLTTNAAGTVVLALAVTDNTGAVGRTTLALQVAAPATSSAGGGAIDLSTLAGLICIVLATMAWQRTQRRRQMLGLNPVDAGAQAVATAPRATAGGRLRRLRMKGKKAGQ